MTNTNNCKPNELSYRVNPTTLKELTEKEILIFKLGLISSMVSMKKITHEEALNKVKSLCGKHKFEIQEALYINNLLQDILEEDSLT